MKSPRRHWLPWVVLIAWIFPLGPPPAPHALGTEPKTLLLIGQGPDGHPSGTHEYAAGLQRLAELLAPEPELKIEVLKADGAWPEGNALIARADGAVLFLAEGARWSVAEPRRHEALTRLAGRGGGLVALHWALGTKAAEPIEPFLKLLGGCHGGPDRKYQVVETELRVAEPAHPIARGLRTFRARDEFYYQLKFVAPRGSVRPVLEAMIDGRPETVAWAWERPDGGRSAGFSGLHVHDNWRLPEYRTFLTQAVRWTMKLPMP
jgi:hypothetical protein